ncbi:TPA: hypothetical protein KQG29_001386 [Clostridioides difficile]|nr:hypothetical protein [Clostridioides difficile]
MKVHQAQINEYIKRDILTCSLEELRDIIKNIIKLLQNNQIGLQENRFGSYIILKENFYYTRDILLEESKLNKNINFFLFNAYQFTNDFNVFDIKKLQKLFKSTKASSAIFIEISDIDELSTFAQKMLFRKIKKIKNTHNKMIFIATLSSQKNLEKLVLENNSFNNIIKVYQDDKENIGIMETLEKYNLKFSNDFPIYSLTSILENLREKDWLYILFHAKKISRERNCDEVIFVEHFKEAIKSYSKYHKGPEKFDLNNI